MMDTNGLAQLPVIKSTQIMPVQELLADPTDVVRVVSKINLAQQAADWRKKRLSLENCQVLWGFGVNLKNSFNDP